MKFVIVLTAVLSCAAALSFPAAVLAGDGEIRLGAILPLTGEAASGGNACKNGLLLAHESLPPELRDRVKLSIEDNGFNSGRAVSAYNKLVASEHIDALTVWDSGSANAIAPLAEKARVTLVAECLDPHIVEGRQYAFNFWVTPEAQANAQVQEGKRRGYKRIAIFVAQHAGLLAIRHDFRGMSGNAFEIVFDEEFGADVQDFHSALLRMKDKGPIDAIGVYLLFGQTGAFAKQVRELGISAALFGTEAFEDPSIVAASQGALIGQWYTQASDPSGEFLDAYHRRFPGASTYSSGNCYDVVLLAAESLKRNVPLVELLHTLKDFHGAMGTISSTGDSRFTLPAIIREVTADGFRTLER